MSINAHRFQISVALLEHSKLIRQLACRKCNSSNKKTREIKIVLVKWTFQ